MLDKGTTERGLTRIEALVVFAGFLLFFSLLMTVIWEAREKARQTQCRSNLHLLGVALNAYHDQHNFYPPGIMTAAIGPQPSPNCQFVSSAAQCDDIRNPQISGLTLILPFMEGRATYASYNLGLACCAMQNATATATSLKGFVCPLNMNERKPMRWGYYAAPPGIAAVGPAPTDYVFATGGVGVFTCDDPFPKGAPKQLRGIPEPQRLAFGAFGVNRVVSREMIHDGTANTILMGESPASRMFDESAATMSGGPPVQGDESLSCASASPYSGQAWSQGYIGSRNGNGGLGSVFGATAFNAWFDSNRSIVNPSAGMNWTSYPINEGGNRFARPTWAAGNAPNWGYETGPRAGSNFPGGLGSCQGFRSNHPMAAQFLFADGSVQQLSQHINPRILLAISTIHGRESTSDEAYEEQ